MAQNDETQEYDNPKPFKSKLECLKFIQKLEAKAVPNVPSQAPVPPMGPPMAGPQMPPGMPMSGRAGLPPMPPPGMGGVTPGQAANPMEEMLRKKLGGR